MSELRVAIVGAGLAGTWHARYARRAGAAIGAVVDPNPQAATGLVRAIADARTFSSLNACLRKSDVNIVHICTPADTHASLASEALNAKRHVLIEKPATKTPQELRALLDLASKNHMKLSVVHQFPLQRGMQSLRSRLSRLGEIASIEFITCSAGGDQMDAGKRRELLLEILPHPLALFYCLLGPRLDPAALHICRFTSDELALDGAAQNVRLSAVIDLQGRPTRNELVVTGTTGTGHVDLFHGYCFFESGQTSRQTKATRPLRYGAKLLLAATGNLLLRTLWREPAYPGLRQLIASFYQSVIHDSPVPVGAAEMILVADAVERVRNSQTP